MIPVDIYAGFLGAGKTTLIKKMLSEAYAGEKVMLIENEFGEVGIDGARFENGELTVTEIDSGCICCSLTGDFTRALEEAVMRYRPDRVVIEPSGVAKMSDVKKAVAAAARKTGGLKADACVTVADAVRVKARLDAYAEFYDDQIAHASLIVLSRTQKLTDARVTEAVCLIRDINPDATVVTTPWELLDGRIILDEARDAFGARDRLYDELMDSIAPGAEYVHHHGQGEHSHDADELFSSFGAETPKRYTREALATILSELGSGRYGAVLRAKGTVDSGDGFLCFDYVPGEETVVPCEPATTGRFCVIGIGLDKRAIGTLFGV